MRRFAAPLMLIALSACRHPQHFVPFEDAMPAVAIATAPRPTSTTLAPVPVLPRSSRGPKPEPRATGDVWGRLGACESGNNPRSVGGGGRFFGAFQMTPGSWGRYGNGGAVLEQPYAEQLAAAKRQQAAEGWRPWPVCGRRARGL